MAGKAGKPVSVTIGATLSASLGSSVREAKSQLGRLGAALSDLDKKKAGVEQLQRLKGETNELGRAYAQARKRSEELRRAFTAAGPPTKKQADEMRAAERATEKAHTSLVKQREALRELGASLRSAGTDTKHLASESARLGGQLDMLRSRTQALQRAQQSLQTNRDKRGQYVGGMMSSVAVGASLAAPAKVAMDFEAQMSRVGAIGNMTDKQLAELTAEARQKGRDTMFTGVEVGQGMEYLTMAGFNYKQVKESIGGVLDVAAAAGTDLGRTSDIVSNVLTGFGLAADQSERVGDVLTKTFTSSNTTLESLGETMKYVAPVAKSAGASPELALAMAGVMGDAGIQGSMSGTAMKSIFLRLIDPAKAGAEALDQMGISAEQMQELMANGDLGGGVAQIKKMGIAIADENGNLRDWMDILKEVSIKMQNMTQQEKLASASAIAGKYAVSGFLAVLNSINKDQGFIDAALQNAVESGATDEEIAQLRERLEKSSKLEERLYQNQLASQERTARKVAARMLDNAKGDLTKLGSAVSDLGIAVGNVLSPSIRSSAQNLTVLANKASALVERFPRLSKAVFLGVGAVLALTIGTYALGFAWTVLKEPFLRMGAVFAKVRAEQALLQISNAKTGASATLLSAKWGTLKGGVGKVGGVLQNLSSHSIHLLALVPGLKAVTIAAVGAAIPFGPLLVVIGAVALAALLLRKYWEPVSVWLGGVWEGMREGLQPFIDAFAPLEPMLTGVGNAIGAVVDWFGSLLEPVRGTKEEMDAWAASGRSFGRVLGQAFNSALTPIRLMAESIGKVIEAAVWLRDHSPQEIGASIKGAVGDAWDSTKGAASRGWNKALSWVGLGDEEDDRPAPSRLAPRPVAARSVTSNTTNAPVVNITVPPGAPAREIAQAAMEAVMEALRGTGLETAGLYD